MTYNGPNDFVHLNTHTVYSMSAGVASVDQYIKKCQAHGFKAIAFTETNNLASVPDCYFECKKAGIKYIPGAVVYFNDFEPARKEMAETGTSYQSFRDSNPQLYQRFLRSHPLTLLCKNRTGFHNLIKLTSIMTKDGLFNGRPRVWFELLEEYKEGLIVLSGGLSGPIGHEVFLNLHGHFIRTPYTRGPSEKTAEQQIARFKKAFGHDFVIELQMPLMPETHDSTLFAVLYKLAKSNDLKCVLTNNCFYIDQESHRTQKLMAAIDQGTTIHDINLRYTETDQLYFKTRAQLWETYTTGDYSKRIETVVNNSEKVFHELCDTTVNIANLCDAFEPDLAPKVPSWEAIANVDPDKELRRIVAEELFRRGLHNDPKKYEIDGRMVTCLEQAVIECDRFVEKGFSSYFLITRDLVGYGRSKGWPFGPRGSVVGSFVCYLLGIHSIFPLPFKLSFDRFMSSSRGGYMLNMKMS